MLQRLAEEYLKRLFEQAAVYLIDDGNLANSWPHSITTRYSDSALATSHRVTERVIAAQWRP